MVAQSDDDCTSQRGQFNENTNLIVLLGPVHAVGKHQPSLSVGVSDLHCQSLSACDDVRRPVCVLADEIFNKSDAAGEIYSQLLPYDCLEC